MLLTSGRLRADSDRYAFEAKWDGFRAVIHAMPSAVTVTSLNGHDMTSGYPELQGLSGAVERSEWSLAGGLRPATIVGAR